MTKVLANLGKPLPPVKQLLGLFRYNSETGTLLRVKTNSIVKNKNDRGYLKTRVNGGNEVPVHRIIWKIMTGRDPIGEIDHINGNRSDNRWVNLREATRKQNNRNASIRSDNRAGYKGVSFSRGRYIARIKQDGKEHYIGSFWSPEEASEAYKKKAIELHAEFSPAHRERNQIIERCAQVAETLAFPYQVHAATGVEDMRAATRKEIASAIRALKEET